jgi:hypothetical protein
VSSPESTFIPAKIVKRVAVARVRDDASRKLSIYLQPPPQDSCLLDKSQE